MFSPLRAPTEEAAALGATDPEFARRLVRDLLAYRSVQQYEESRLILDSAIRLVEKGEGFFFGAGAQGEQAVPEDAAERADDLSVDSFDFKADDDDEEITELSAENATEFCKKIHVYAFCTDSPFRVDKPWGRSAGLAGDWLVVGPRGDLYAIPDAKFKATYEPVAEQPNQFRKSVTVFGRRMLRDFAVTARTGGAQQAQQGREGDFLVQDPSGEQWVVAGPVFHDTYEPTVLSQHRRMLDAMKSAVRPAAAARLPDADDPMSVVYLSRRRRNEVLELLETTASDWDFDVFALASLTNGHPLFHLASYLFEAHGLVSSLQLDPEVFARFLLQCEVLHQGNPYHCAAHSADALQAASFFLLHTDLMAQLQNEEVFALLLGTVVVGVGHPGTDNHFQVATQSELALFYNDQCVIQHFLCAQAFQLMRSERCNVLEVLDEEQAATVRRTLVQAMLAQEPSSTPTLLKRFNSRRAQWLSLAERSEMFGSSPAARWRPRGGSMIRAKWLPPAGAAAPASGSARGKPPPASKAALAANSEAPEFARENQPDRLLVVSMALHCATISYATKTPALHQKWARLLEEEYQQQFEREMQLQLPDEARSPTVLAACTNFARQQSEYLEAVARPSYVAFCEHFGLSHLTEMIDTNASIWQHSQKASEVLTAASTKPRR